MTKKKKIEYIEKKSYFYRVLIREENVVLFLNFVLVPISKWEESYLFI